jgi:DNA repair exonuclease SbcCD ATPase subunit
MLKKLKSLFIVEEEKSNPSPEAKDKKKAPEAPKSSPEVKKKEGTNPNISKPGQNAPIDTEVMEKLLAAIEANNQTGFDYLEYKNSLKALEKIPMDEATRFKSAFATAATMGVTLEKLTSSVNFYLDVLKREEKKFSHAIEETQDQGIAKKEEEQRLINDLIKKKAEQIKILTQEIEAHQKKTKEVTDEIKTAKDKINSTRDKFNAAYSHLKNQFEKDIDKMLQYLK